MSVLIRGSECVRGFREANGVSVSVVDGVVPFQESVAVDKVKSTAGAAANVSHNEVDGIICPAELSIELCSIKSGRLSITSAGSCLQRGAKFVR